MVTWGVSLSRVWALPQLDRKRIRCPLLQEVRRNGAVGILEFYAAHDFHELTRYGKAELRGRVLAPAPDDSVGRIGR